LAAPRDAENFKGEKILIRKITSKTLLATYVKDTSYCNTLLFILKLKDKSIPYLATLGILNSKLIGWYFSKKYQINESDTFPQIMIRDILEFPFPEFSNSKGQELSKNVENILDINSEVKKTTLQSKQDILNSKLAFYEQQVNKLVYSLYNLNSQEIEKIEQS
jgi:adenine-specific DNA-methyltransferase